MCYCCLRNGHNIAECRQKQEDNQNKPQKHREPNKSFYQYVKKDQNLPNKNILSNNSLGKPLPDMYNASRQQLHFRYNYRGRSPDQKNSQNISQKRHNRSNSQNNRYRNIYSRLNSNNSNYSNFVKNNSGSNSGNRYYSNNRSINSSHSRNRIYSNNRNRQYQNNRSRDYSNNRSNYHRSNFNNYHNRIIQIAKNHRTEIVHNIRTHNKTIELVHLNVKDNLTNYIKLKKLNQTLPVLITQKPQNYI